MWNLALVGILAAATIPPAPLVSGSTGDGQVAACVTPASYPSVQKWPAILTAYPGTENLKGLRISIRRGAALLGQFECSTPELALNLAPGSYTVRIESRQQSQTFWTSVLDILPGREQLSMDIPVEPQL